MEPDEVSDNAEDAVPAANADADAAHADAAHDENDRISHQVNGRARK